MSDQRCLCPASVAETVRDDAVDRALAELDGEARPTERAAVASLADRLTVRLFVLTVASCPRHGPSRPPDRDGDVLAARQP